MLTKLIYPYAKECASLNSQSTFNKFEFKRIYYSHKKLSQLHLINLLSTLLVDNLSLTIFINLKTIHVMLQPYCHNNCNFDGPYKDCLTQLLYHHLR